MPLRYDPDEFPFVFPVLNSGLLVGEIEGFVQVDHTGALTIFLYKAGGTHKDYVFAVEPLLSTITSYLESTMFSELLRAQNSARELRNLPEELP